jgi:hypothetical protein
MYLLLLSDSAAINKDPPAATTAPVPSSSGRDGEAASHQIRPGGLREPHPRKRRAGHRVLRAAGSRATTVCAIERGRERLE